MTQTDKEVALAEYITGPEQIHHVTRRTQDLVMMTIDEVKLWKMYNTEVGNAMNQEREWLKQHQLKSWYKGFVHYRGLEVTDVDRRDGWPNESYKL